MLLIAALATFINENRATNLQIPSVDFYKKEQETLRRINLYTLHPGLRVDDVLRRSRSMSRSVRDRATVVMNDDSITLK